MLWKAAAQLRKSATRRNKAMYCVVMGDIINSRELSDDTRQKVKRAAQSAFDRINTKYMDSLMAHFGMVRGDAFEGVILTQSYAPQIVQDIIKAVYAVEKTTVRISVVLGELSVTDGDRNNVDGPAFHRALERLDELKKKNSSHWLQVHFDIGTLAQGLVDGHLALLAALTEGWTDKQRAIVWEMENSDNYQKAVARRLKTTAPVVNKQLKAASYEAYRMAWDGLADYLAKMDEYVVEGKRPVDKSYVPFFNVAKRRLNQADFSGALKPAKKALSIAKQSLSTDDAQFSAIYNFLAEIYMGAKQYENAEESILEALRIQEPMPKARLEYSVTLYAKARLCWLLGNIEDAIKYNHDALAIARNIVDVAHPHISFLHNDLAVLHKGLGEYEYAMELYDKSLSAMDEDKDPISYAIVLSNIANCYCSMRDFSNALPRIKKALQLLEENLPPNHEYITSAQAVLEDILSPQEAGL